MNVNDNEIKYPQLELVLKIGVAMLFAIGIIWASFEPVNVWAETMTPIAIKTHIDTDKFVETRAFYTGILGLEVLQEWDDDGDVGCILGFSIAGTTGFLEIAKADSPSGFEGLSLQFRVADIEAVAKSLAGKWPFEGPVVRPWGSTYLYLDDPNGMPIIVFEGDI